jgi:signal transduction histidine kinase
VRGFALASVAFAGSVAIALVLVTLVWWAIRLLNPILKVILIGSYGSGWYLAGLLILGAAAMAAACAALAAMLSREEVVAGALLCFAELAVLMAAAFPPASYILVWPLLASLPACAWMVAAPRAARPGWQVAVMVLAVMAATVVVLPAGLVGFDALTVRIDSLTGLPAFAPPALFTILLAGLLLPLVSPTPGAEGPVPVSPRCRVSPPVLAPCCAGSNGCRPRRSRFRRRAVSAWNPVVIEETHRYFATHGGKLQLGPADPLIPGEVITEPLSPGTAYAWFREAARRAAVAGKPLGMKTDAAYPRLRYNCRTELFKFR